MINYTFFTKSLEIKSGRPLLTNSLWKTLQKLSTFSVKLLRFFEIFFQISRDVNSSVAHSPTLLAHLSQSLTFLKIFSISREKNVFFYHSCPKSICSFSIKTFPSTLRFGVKWKIERGENVFFFAFRREAYWSMALREMVRGNGRIELFSRQH